MNSKTKLFSGVIGLILILLFSTSCKKDNEDVVLEQQYTGTLTVMQKDAYSDVAGRSSELWPPHTTTVFKWDNDSVVQLNHGTAPDEVDAQGNLFLEVRKVYTYTGTKSQIESLQASYEDAIYDDATHKFFDLTIGTAILEESFLEGVKQYFADDANGLICTGTITKDSLIALFEAGEYHLFGAELPNCNWGQSEWIIAFETVLGDILSDLGENLNDYHVCNNDAKLQVDLIKNFMATGKVTMPVKVYDGPMMFYTPE